jgi:hypothetical protein
MIALDLFATLLSFSPSASILRFAALRLVLLD